jgi:2-aminoethylphosphonate-pyruvate transaminase
LKLLTPGPLSTADAVRAAMTVDRGSRDAEFLALTAEVRRGLLAVAGANAAYAAVPLQGSGTFAVEAAIGTLVPREGRLLVLVNGAYGRRMVQIARRIGVPVDALEVPETTPIRADALAGRPTHVAMVHCETTTGIENPLAAVAAACREAGAALIVDAMSSFGALPIEAARQGLLAVVASANKCLEGAPGVSFVVARRDALLAAEGRCHSVALDLHEQLAGFERDGQWRFTPPTHVVAALAEALRRLDAEGVDGRRDRYRQNLRVLVDGLRARGFRTLLAEDVQAPIIATFLAPTEGWYGFDAFHAGLRARGFVIYPGKTTAADTFRIGVIGDVTPRDLAALLGAVDAVVAELR